MELTPFITNPPNLHSVPRNYRQKLRECSHQPLLLTSINEDTYKTGTMLVSFVWFLIMWSVKLTRWLMLNTSGDFCSATVRSFETANNNVGFQRIQKKLVHNYWFPFLRWGATRSVSTYLFQQHLICIMHPCQSHIKYDLKLKSSDQDNSINYVYHISVCISC